MKGNNKLQFLWQVLNRYDAYIKSTNNKASLLLTLNLFAISSLVLQRKRILSYLELSGNARTGVTVALSIVVIASAFSLLFAFLAVRPNTKSGTEEGEASSVFFGDVSRHNSTESYSKALKNADSENLFDDLVIQTHTLADIANGKFNYLKYSFYALGLAMAIFVALSFMTFLV